eukprot:gene8357-9257_t
MCTGCATDKEAEEDDEDEDDEANQVLGQKVKAQGCRTLKRKKKLAENLPGLKRQLMKLLTWCVRTKTAERS